MYEVERGRGRSSKVIAQREELEASGNSRCPGDYLMQEDALSMGLSFRIG